ncbi:hypothetical protein U8335_20345 [Roseiconus lacunae]|uniref:hypothetical protein n=1 Tax=Roseiconus lacunae TaxID=2605694 RepID=UPI00308642AC|nr:hypothetical protein U8335_20345 [Stieleria sp. HD01]
MQNKALVIILVIFWGVEASQGHAEVTFAIETSQGIVSIVDPVSGERTFVSSIGGGNGIASATHDPFTDTTYVIAGNNLMTLNRFEGSLALIGALDRPNMRAVAFDHSTRRLWGATSQQLLLFDETDGSSTVVGDFGLIATDLSFDPTSDVLYGVSNISNSLFTVDTSTGAATLSDQTIGFEGATALTIDSMGNAFGTDLGPSLGFTQYLSIDTDTGIANPIGDRIQSELYTAVFSASASPSAIPEPAVGIVLGSFLCIGVMRRGQRVAR